MYTGSGWVCGVLLQTGALSAKQTLAAAAASSAAATTSSLPRCPLSPRVSAREGASVAWALSCSSVLPLYFFCAALLLLCLSSDRQHEYLGNLLAILPSKGLDLRCVPEESYSREGEAWRSARQKRWGSDAGERRGGTGMIRVRWWWALG